MYICYISTDQVTVCGCEQKARTELLPELEGEDLAVFEELQQSAPHPQLSTPNTQHSTLDTRHSTLNTQHSPLTTQHPKLDAHHSPLTTQHPPLKDDFFM